MLRKYIILFSKQFCPSLLLRFKLKCHTWRLIRRILNWKSIEVYAYYNLKVTYTWYAATPVRCPAPIDCIVKSIVPRLWRHAWSHQAEEDTYQMMHSFKIVSPNNQIEQSDLNIWPSKFCFLIERQKLPAKKLLKYPVIRVLLFCQWFCINTTFLPISSEFHLSKRSFMAPPDCLNHYILYKRRDFC